VNKIIGEDISISLKEIFDSIDRSTNAAKIKSLNELISELETRDIFNKSAFYEYRHQAGTQHDLAESMGVSQGTIGNWERGTTYPNKPKRTQILEFCRIQVASLEKSIFEQKGDIEVSIDTVKTADELNSSILKAAITDFDFDQSKGQLIAIPFSEDTNDSLSDEILDAQADLMKALFDQSTMIIQQLSRFPNQNSEKIRQHVERYSEECKKNKPNPRILHRYGKSIRLFFADSEIRISTPNVDQISIDGFNDDHSELMRLFHRQALVQAQKVESAFLDDEGLKIEARDFTAIASELEKLRSENGKSVVSAEITAIVRDIAREIAENADAERLTFGHERRKKIQDRRKEALKNGAIFVGRLVFFSALFITIGPASATVATSQLAAIATILDHLSPGSPRRLYRKMQQFFPLLPSLPLRE
jgi:transcriptional regulator with XRE-family HTH domain